MDVPVNVIAAEPLDEAVRAQHDEHVGLHAREPQRSAVAFHELVDRGELLRALRVDEVTPSRAGEPVAVVAIRSSTRAGRFAA
jgi:hypothetical protein